MICTRTNGITINSSERPNMPCGNSRLSQPRWRISKLSGAGATGGSAGSAGSATTPPSLGLEDIAGAAHGLQVTRITWIALDLAAQPGHLHVDIADVAAERCGLRQLLPRHRLAGPLCQDREEPGLGRRQMHVVAAARQLAATPVEAKSAETDRAFGAVGGRPPLQDVADAQHQFARLERLCQVVVGAPFEAVDP